MRKLSIVIAALLLANTQAFAAEDFKGTPPKTQFTVGVLSGLGTINSDAGFSVLANGAFRIVEKGFITQDINNQVFLELFAGPTFGLTAGPTADETAFHYSVHLRWDFPKDDDWTLYAVGGMGGYVMDGTFRVMPRFGVGGFLNLSPMLALRGEVSADLIAVGVSFPF